MAGLNNPYGNPYQYRPGQGTQTFSPSSSGGSGVATRIFSGTTYYGGQTAVISGTTRIVSATAVVGGTTIMSGTTTWVSGTPGVVGGTSTVGNAQTAAPITGPSPTPVTSYENHHISGGSVAGIVLGCLAATALAVLLGWCWRRKRSEHTTVYNNTATTYDNRGPTRTVVTEKIEPVVVKSVPTGTSASAYNTTATGAAGAPAVAVNTAGVHNPHGSSTTYNTTTPTTGYNTQPRVPGVVDSAGVNSVGTGLGNATNTVGSGAHGAVNPVGSTTNTVGTGAHTALH